MAKPNKKLPNKTVQIFCSKCRSKLFKYAKGGTGSLLKCFRERIREDYTIVSCRCPNCNVLFARETLIKGTPAYKIIGGKVYTK